MIPKFTLDDGSAEFSNGLSRQNYRLHHTEIRTLADLKATLRAGAYTHLGCYPLYFLTADGDTLSFDGVRQDWRTIVWDYNNLPRQRIVACDVNWEDVDMICAITGEPIPSAYGD